MKTGQSLGGTLQAKGHRDGQWSPEAGQDKEGLFPSLGERGTANTMIPDFGLQNSKEYISIFQPHTIGAAL